ncbi:MAG: TIR domain-containing protein, partial [Chloroflexi bacterium]|nr:TIR domain-containing protein [Chloroflexota bacterium]
MTDVFISYSRRDEVFAKKLHAALEESNRDAWADWNSIPAASDWMAEIREGIGDAESIVFVISPEWIKSVECRKEFDYAVEMGKRMFPVIYKPVDAKDIPPELARINWVHMQKGEDFEKAFRVLSDAIDTDLDWVKGHTRIQLRAVEWNKNNRDRSFILRGKELADGEQFLASASHKNPEPTALQGEYILASRKEAIRAQRAILGGVVAALIVSVLLGIIAVFQWQAARRSEADAKRQTVIARAGQLSAQSFGVRDQDFRISTLLGIEGLSLFDNLQTRGTMFDLANANPRLRQVFAGHTFDVGRVAFSPDGSFIASAGWDHMIGLWDVKTGQLDGEFLKGHSDWVYDVAFSPDGKTLASAGRDGMIILWDVESRTPIGEPIADYGNGVLRVT